MTEQWITDRQIINIVTAHPPILAACLLFRLNPKRTDGILHTATRPSLPASLGKVSTREEETSCGHGFSVVPRSSRTKQGLTGFYGLLKDRCYAKCKGCFDHMSSLHCSISGREHELDCSPSLLKTDLANKYALCSSLCTC